MIEFIVALIVIFAALAGILGYVSGDRQALADPLRAGAVYVVVGVFGGFVLAAYIPMLLVEHGIASRSVWFLAPATLAIWGAWNFAVHRVVSRLAATGDA